MDILAFDGREHFDCISVGKEAEASYLQAAPPVAFAGRNGRFTVVFPTGWARVPKVINRRKRKAELVSLVWLPSRS